MTQSDIINNNFSKAFECIKCSNAYNTGEVLSEEKLFKQISERKHSTFDLSKFTVVGNPTITDDGIASGLNGSNYIKTSVIIPANSEIKVTGRFTMPKSTFGDRAIIFHYGDTSSNRIWLQIEYGDKLQLAGGDGSKRATSTNKLDYGATYDYECIFNGSNLLTLKFKKIEDKDFTIVNSYDWKR